MRVPMSMRRFTPAPISIARRPEAEFRFLLVKLGEVLNAVASLSMGTTTVQRMYSSALFCFVFATMCGCASTTKQGNGYQTRSYFGWITVQEKLQASGDAVVERITTVGLRMGTGLGLGYFDDTRVLLPQDCRLVIFVNDLEQMENLFRAYPPLKEGGNPCVKPNAP
jgi:hypothetical protein